tara:strand:- start:670 stop:1143 length:474 start_codon:yes stop_codon:yes gene_type:complete
MGALVSTIEHRLGTSGGNLFLLASYTTLLLANLLFCILCAAIDAKTWPVTAGALTAGFSSCIHIGAQLVGAFFEVPLFVLSPVLLYWTGDILCSICAGAALTTLAVPDRASMLHVSAVVSGATTISLGISSYRSWAAYKFLQSRETGKPLATADTKQ